MRLALAISHTDDAGIVTDERGVDKARAGINRTRQLKGRRELETGETKVRITRIDGIQLWIGCFRIESAHVDHAVRIDRNRREKVVIRRVTIDHHRRAESVYGSGAGCTRMDKLGLRGTAAGGLSRINGVGNVVGPTAMAGKLLVR